MHKTAYRTTPVATEGMPPGIPFIIGNEAAERFSYYGMNSILVVFMTHHLLNAKGQLDPMSPEQAQEKYHLFVMGMYLLPILGSILADAVLGKFRTIMILSVVYCLGHFALAINDTRMGLLVGLSMIAIGAGGIKPCVSANVGDQFGEMNQHLLPRVYSWFYFSINFGSAASTILIPYLLDKHGAKVAFGTPGIFMLLATIVFWMGRRRFVHAPPAGRRFWAELTGPEGLRSMANLMILVPFVAMFWAIWQQNFSSWVVQAEKMDRVVFGREWLPAQIQTVNPVFILILIPMFSYWIYPAIQRVFPLTPLRKIGIGLFVAVVAFLIPAWIESQIVAGGRPTIWWQILAFVLLTVGEIMVSITHLEFSYTQAPASLKSLVMALYLLAISLGNAFTAGVNWFIQNPDGSSKLSGPSYFLFFAGMMLATAVLYIFAAKAYRGKSHLIPAAATSS